MQSLRVHNQTDMTTDAKQNRRALMPHRANPVPYDNVCRPSLACDIPHFRNSTRLFWFACEECIAEDLEQSCLTLPTSAAEGINRWAYVDIYKATFFQHPPPACARQATGNSVGPQVDIADSRFRYSLSGCNIGELQPPIGAQHP